MQFYWKLPKVLEEKLCLILWDMPWYRGMFKTCYFPHDTGSVCSIATDLCPIAHDYDKLCFVAFHKKEFLNVCKNCDCEPNIITQILRGETFLFRRGWALKPLLVPVLVLWLWGCYRPAWPLSAGEWSASGSHWSHKHAGVLQSREHGIEESRTWHQTPDR